MRYRLLMWSTATVNMRLAPAWNFTTEELLPKSLQR